MEGAHVWPNVDRICQWKLPRSGFAPVSLNVRLMTGDASFISCQLTTDNGRGCK